jgi:hypothetical protein
MGYNLRVYLVDTEEIKRIPGSNDTELLEEILEARGDDFADYDEQQDPFGEDYDPPFTHAEALREIFAGRYTRPDCGVYYGWAFDLLCAYLGKWMHQRGNNWPTAWLSRLDAALAEGRVDLRFWGGLVEKCPVPLPPNPDSIPGIGHWTYEQIVTALPKFEEMVGRVEDKALLLSLKEDMLLWLRAGAKRPGSMLIGVYG